MFKPGDIVRPKTGTNASLSGITEPYVVDSVGGYRGKYIYIVGLDVYFFAVDLELVPSLPETGDLFDVTLEFEVAKVSAASGDIIARCTTNGIDSTFVFPAKDITVKKKAPRLPTEPGSQIEVPYDIPHGRKTNTLTLAKNGYWYLNGVQFTPIEIAAGGWKEVQ